jgi:hypothetical protein
MSFPAITGLPPATFILAGVSRGGKLQQLPLPALAEFGVVCFDEISATPPAARGRSLRATPSP